MSGLKNVRSRRDDALSRVRWDEFEILLATYYRGQGYDVEHVGTGGTGGRFDGGIDLKLRKDDQYVLVQCKRWNAKQVPHNAVHELLGIMVNQSATGAILVSSGEFTRAAIEAATRQGHVQLVDGEDLRAMLGPVAESHMPTSGLVDVASPIVAHVGERLLRATEDRVRGDGPNGRQHRHVEQRVLSLLLLKLVLPLVFLFVVMLTAFSVIKHAILGLQPVTAAHAQPMQLPTPQATSSQVLTEMPASPAEAAPKQGAEKPMSPAERAERKRRDDEAMRRFNENTPEM